MKARDFDEKFDSGADVSGDVDWTKARRPNLEFKRVNVDFPVWVVEALDHEARRLGVTPASARQTLDRRTAWKGGVTHPDAASEGEPRAPRSDVSP